MAGSFIINAFSKLPTKSASELADSKTLAMHPTGAEIHREQLKDSTSSSPETPLPSTAWSIVKNLLPVDVITPTSITMPGGGLSEKTTSQLTSSPGLRTTSPAALAAGLP
jgi:hypothetical protein